MAVSTSANEIVKPYLEAVLAEVGTNYEDAVRIGVFDTDIEFNIEMLPETYNNLNWATCHARVTSVIRNADRPEANQQVSDLINHVARLIQRRAERNQPVILGKGPPWFPPIGITATQDKSKPTQLTVVWELDIPTAIGGF
jgi:hypothetical protein